MKGTFSGDCEIWGDFIHEYGHNGMFRRVSHGVKKCKVQSPMRNKALPRRPGILKVTDVYRG